MHMALIMVRTVIVFLVLLIIMRLMGKRQIGEMQPFELGITLLISERACIPMAAAAVPSGARKPDRTWVRQEVE